MDRDDHDLLTFAIRWLPYGGGPDDEILINFGSTRQRYLHRLRETVERQRRHIHPHTFALLMQLCDGTSAASGNRDHQPPAGASFSA
jgi:hypothetical protein